MKYLLAISLLIGSLSVAAKTRANLGLGYGEVDQKYGSFNDDIYSVLSGYLEFQYDWHGILFGLNFSQVQGGKDVLTQNQGDIWVGGPFLGLSALDRLDVFVGYGVGRSKRSIQTPAIRDIHHDGVGLFAGARLYLLDLKAVQVGLSAQYFELSDDLYSDSSVVGNEVKADAESSGIIYGIVISFNEFKVK